MSISELNIHIEHILHDDGINRIGKIDSFAVEPWLYVAEANKPKAFVDISGNTVYGVFDKLFFQTPTHVFIWYRLVECK